MFHASMLQLLPADNGPECPAIIMNGVKTNPMAILRHDRAFLNQSVRAQSLYGHVKHARFAVWRHNESFRGIKMPLLSSLCTFLFVEKAPEEDWVEIYPTILPSLADPQSEEDMPSYKKKEVKQQPAKEKRQ
ncbi:hypothetical protein [Corynebacterium aurimucosum]|uniref:hypothetical protein n=1 Tax=Corynebacterium aurimucosum TaxID=169292 RepID=UPI00375653C1